MIGDDLYLHLIEIGSILLLGLFYTILLIPVVYFFDFIQYSEIIYFTFLLVGTTAILSSIRVWKRYRKKKISKDDIEYIYKITEDINPKIKTSKLYIVPLDSNIPNAYAIDALPLRPRIFLTTSLIRNLSESELKAVIAHEIAHIETYDVYYMTMLSSIVSFLRETHNMTRQSIYSGDIFWFIVGIIPFIVTRLLLLLGNIIFYQCSRIREYKADKRAAEYVNNKSMISALKSITRTMNKTSKKDREKFRDFEPLCIVSIDDIEEKYFKTHPNINERIKSLKNF